MSAQKGSSPIIVIIVVLVALGGIAYIVGLEQMKSWLMPPPAAPVEEGEEAEVPQTTGPLQYKDLVRVAAPLPQTVIGSPLVITGEARGMWYFEASFPIRLEDANGDPVPLDPPYVMTTSEWMTEEYVPFSSTHTFTPPATDTGTLILMKDNPSGLPEHEDALLIPVRFR